jgi:hypothetical protein
MTDELLTLEALDVDALPDIEAIEKPPTPDLGDIGRIEDSQPLSFASGMAIAAGHFPAHHVRFTAHERHVARANIVEGCRLLLRNPGIVH